jgi:thiol:disulfide interchange protein
LNVDFNSADGVIPVMFTGKTSYAEAVEALTGKEGQFNVEQIAAVGGPAAGKQPLWRMLGIAFLGGLILNLMPCVLPVIGLKILSFVEQSGRNRGHVFWLNVWYSLGLLSVFMILATLPVISRLWLGRQFGWGEQFSFYQFNIALAAIVFVMALSFLGIWEIPIPGFVGSGKAGDLASQEGFSGAFCKGAVTTVLATPCSGPFLGTALAFAFSQPAQVTYAMFACIGLGMASPYLLIGAFPQLMRFLPKPGVWMDTFKQLMGFVLLGTVVYLMSLIPADKVIPTLAFLIGLWAACWWIGRTPLYAEFGTKLRAWGAAAVVAGLVGFFSFAWTGGGEKLPWQPFSMAELERLTGEEKTVMVDFTADWCLTCKALEKFILNTSETKEFVTSHGVVPLVADMTEYPPEERELLKKLSGGEAVPVLAIFPAGRPQQPIVLVDSYTKGILLDKLKQAGPSKGAGAGKAAMAMAK